jgi:hypothetical protein
MVFPRNQMGEASLWQMRPTPRPGGAGCDLEPSTIRGPMGCVSFTGLLILQLTGRPAPKSQARMFDTAALTFTDRRASARRPRSPALTCQSVPGSPQGAADLPWVTRHFAGTVRLAAGRTISSDPQQGSQGRPDTGLV